MEWRQEYTKPAIYLGLGALGIWALSQFDLFKGAKKVIDDLADGSFFDGETDTEENRRIKKEFDLSVKDGLMPTYSDKEFKEGAEKLYTALRRAGNDLDKIAEVFDGCNNVQDVRKLVAFFDMRGEENLNEWLKSDLIGFKMYVTLKSGKLWLGGFVTVADMVRAILKQKNINFAI